MRFFSLLLFVLLETGQLLFLRNMSFIRLTNVARSVVTLFKIFIFLTKCFLWDIIILRMSLIIPFIMFRWVFSLFLEAKVTFLRFTRWELNLPEIKIVFAGPKLEPVCFTDTQPCLRHSSWGVHSSVILETRQGWGLVWPSHTKWLGQNVQSIFEAYIFLKLPESIICLLNISPY